MPTSKHLVQRAAIKLWRRATPTFKISIGEANLKVSSNNQKAAAILTWEPNWKTQLIHHSLATRQGDFLDIGANVGQTLLDYCAAGNGSRYLGFEPFPASYASLRVLIDENHLEDCVVLPVGLADQTTILNIYTDAGATTDSGASLLSDFRPTRHVRPTPVATFRLDEITDPLGISAISLIKIDVEGAELSVLRGMTETLAKYRAPVMCEILYADAAADMSAHKTRLDGIMALTKTLDYSIFRIDQGHEGQKLSGLTQVQELTAKVWTEENSHECDYLLLAAEARNQFDALIG